jgi:hypothetical protein
MIEFIFTFIGILVLIIYSSTKPTNSFLDKLTNKLGVITGFFIAIGIFITYQIFKTNLNYNNRLITIKQIKEGWIDINKLLVTYYKKCPTLIDSFYYDWQKPASLLTREDNFHASHYVAVTIFQSWDNYLTNKSFDLTEDVAWIVTFLQFAKSPHLKKQWEITKSNYNVNCIKLGDLLFSFAKKHVPHNHEELKQYANDFQKLKEFQSILENSLQK